MSGGSPISSVAGRLNAPSPIGASSANTRFVAIVRKTAADEGLFPILNGKMPENDNAADPCGSAALRRLSWNSLRFAGVRTGS
ncbi:MULTISPECIES: hypothetical protein [Phyllobacteriaceae]|uniref:hypothetical protein n=1 Tax=Phyllobacteriaceae TaxID=69277 RepID=UPI0010F64617|nr:MULTISPECIES: hypothetical protein [Mesorhizobium]MBN9234206.1 hypothetical protein [Mesorhizobium sp.]MDQ0332271.1 hypothetical protein [Mesorhizobium sp. YL-MeA3-2017]